ncbi:proline-rich protein 30 [Emydura macquarii macquarii]|uniref:proline-rich protein 30 n=1 Tax=Emydura macquarii macquarii TaxID=1129001 RepID=UPI00352ADF2E
MFALPPLPLPSLGSGLPLALLLAGLWALRRLAARGAQRRRARQGGRRRAGPAPCALREQGAGRRETSQGASCREPPLELPLGRTLRVVEGHMWRLALHLGKVTSPVAWRAEFPSDASSSVDSGPSSLGSCSRCCGREANLTPWEPRGPLPPARSLPRPWHPSCCPGAAAAAQGQSPLPKPSATGPRRHRARSARLPVLGQVAPRGLEFNVRCKHLQALWGGPTPHTTSLARLVPRAPALHPPSGAGGASVTFSTSRVSFLSSAGREELDRHVQSKRLHHEGCLCPAPHAPLHGSGPGKTGADARRSQEPCICPLALPPGDAGCTLALAPAVLGRLSLQAAARLQLHAARKCLEIRAGAVPTAVSVSQGAARPRHPPALPQLLRPGQRHRQPRPSTCPALEPEAVRRLELHLRQKGLRALSGPPALHLPSLALLLPRAPRLPAPRARGAPEVELTEQDTPFLSPTARSSLEWHVRSKRLQHSWGLPSLPQRSLAAFLAPAPRPGALPPRPPREVTVAPQELPFLSRGTQRELESHLVTLQAQRCWGLPGRVQASLPRFMPPAPGHVPAGEPPAPGHMQAPQSLHQPPTPGHAASSRPPTPGHGASSRPPTPGHAPASRPPTPGHAPASRPPTPGHIPASRPPTPGHAASSQPLHQPPKALGHAASSRPPIPGHRASSQPPTPGHASASRPPTPGHTSASRPPTPGHPSAPRPPTPGHTSASRPPTPGHASASRPPTPGHRASSLPPTPGHAPASPPPTPGHAPGSRPPCQLSFKKADSDPSLLKVPGPGRPGAAHPASKLLPRATDPPGSRAAGEEEGSVVRPRGRSGSRHALRPVQHGSSRGDRVPPHRHGAAPQLKRATITSQSRAPGRGQQQPKTGTILRTDTHPTLEARGSEGPLPLPGAGPPPGASASPEWLARAIVRSLGPERAARDLQLRLLGRGRLSVEYPVCLPCGCCLEGGVCPQHPAPRGQRGPRLVVYPKLSVGGSQAGRLRLSLGFLLKVKRKEARKWQLTAEPPSQLGLGTAWEEVPGGLGQPTKQQGPEGALGVRRPGEQPPCRACSQAARPRVCPCPAAPRSGPGVLPLLQQEATGWAGAGSQAPFSQLGSAAGSAVELPGAGKARPTEPRWDPRPPRTQSCALRSPPSTATRTPVPRSQPRPAAAPRRAGSAPRPAPATADTVLQKLWVSVQRAWAKLWGRGKASVPPRRAGGLPVQPAPSGHSRGTKVSS